MEFDVKAGVAETGVKQTRSPSLDTEGEGRTEDIYSLPKYSTNSLESRPATRRKDYTRLVAFLIFLQEGNSKLSFTARIKGAHSDRVTSASQKNGLAAPLPLPSLLVITLPT
jgi:hypothetical protein